MSFTQYATVTVTATTLAASPAETSTGIYTGFIDAIVYTASTGSVGTPSTGGSVTITATKSGLAIIFIADLSSASNGNYYPRGRAHDSTGGQSTSATQKIPLCNESVTFTWADGSTDGTRSGTYALFVT